jgi:hypothetical protein
VGANVFAHSQETILMLGIVTSMVKVTILGCNKIEDNFYLDADLHTSNIAPFVFIDLSSSLSKEGSPSLVESLAMQLCPSLFILFEAMFCQLTSEPSTSILSI